MWKPMPTLIEKFQIKEIETTRFFGSLIYKEPGADHCSLEFFTQNKIIKHEVIEE